MRSWWTEPNTEFWQNVLILFYFFQMLAIKKPINYFIFKAFSIFIFCFLAKFHHSEKKVNLARVFTNFSGQWKISLVRNVLTWDCCSCMFKHFEKSIDNGREHMHVLASFLRFNGEEQPSRLSFCEFCKPLNLWMSSEWSCWILFWIIEHCMNTYLSSWLYNKLLSLFWLRVCLERCGCK